MKINFSIITMQNHAPWSGVSEDLTAIMEKNFQMRENAKIIKLF